MAKLFAYGFMLWGFMFALSSALYPWRIASPRLFEVVTALALAGATTIATVRYLASGRLQTMSRAVKAACIWPVLCLGMDLVMLEVFPPAPAEKRPFELKSLVRLRLAPSTRPTACPHQCPACCVHLAPACYKNCSRASSGT